MSLGPNFGFEFEVVPIAEVPSDSAGLFPEQHRPVILVVDDEHLIADTLAAVLRRGGFAAMAAYDGCSALEVAAVIPPELLITDISMPRMSGVQLALSIVHAIADCKVLLFSGHASHGDLVEARMAGYDFPLLSKPVHPAQMLMHVAESLQFNRWSPTPLVA